MFPRISDYAFHHAAERPDAEAAIFGATCMSYAELADRVLRCAKALLTVGVGKGDRDAMLSTPRPEWLVVLLATADIGAIWVGLHPRYQMPEFRHVVGQSAPKVLIALPDIDGRDYRPELDTLRREFLGIETFVTFPEASHDADSLDTFCMRGDAVADADWQAAREAVGADDTAVIIFTSGTTGAPKGAMIKHLALVHGALVECDRWPSRTLRLLHNMPINHIAGVGMLAIYTVVAGGAQVFMDRFDPQAMLEIIERERITFWLQAPTMFHLAVTQPDFADYDLSSLEYIIWAGSAMPRDLVATLHALDATLATAFGMTELGAYVTYSDLDADFEVLANTIGRPEPRFEFRVADERNNPVAVDRQGEIQARGDWLLAGYFNDPEATAEAFTADGWFRTGDVAEVRADGNLSIVGRMKEMYISGGYNIYPREIEIAVESHPDVATAAVLGVPDPVFGEIGHAFVQPEPGAQVTIDDIDEWCGTRLANYKVPKRFEVGDELPRLPIGKIDKQALRRRLEIR